VRFASHDSQRRVSNSGWVPSFCWQAMPAQSTGGSVRLARATISPIAVSMTRMVQGPAGACAQTASSCRRPASTRWWLRRSIKAGSGTTSGLEVHWTCLTLRWTPFSSTTSLGVLSSRNPRKAGCRISPAAVRSLKFGARAPTVSVTSATVRLLCRVPTANRPPTSSTSSGMWRFCRVTHLRRR
jgi:hypothetical protein